MPELMARIEWTVLATRVSNSGLVWLNAMDSYLQTLYAQLQVQL